MTLYTIVLTLHSLLRWVIVFAAVLAVGRAIAGWLGRNAWTPLDNRLGLLFTSSMDLQLLLGLLLYFGLSPLTRGAFGNMGAAMANPGLRYWTVEHLTAMIVALALVHVGRVRTRRALDGAAKHRQAAIFFGLATLVLLLAIPWPFYSFGRPLLRFG